MGVKGAETLSEVGGGGRPGQQGFLIRLGPRVHGAEGSGGGRGSPGYTSCVSLRCSGMALYGETEAGRTDTGLVLWS